MRQYCNAFNHEDNGGLAASSIRYDMFEFE